jgi:hypothetical protein
MGIEKLDRALLDSYLGKNISDVCTFGFTGAQENHCAHWVSHVLQLSIGYCCGKGGRSIRVQELFAACPTVGAFDDAPSTSFLVFVTAPANVSLSKKVMVNVPRKHIGICYQRTIWHYSNTRDEVITQSPEEFVKHYPHQKNALYFGTFPTIAAPVAATN